MGSQDFLVSKPTEDERGIPNTRRPPSENKIKKKFEKYLDLIRELKKLWNMRVTVIQVIFGALEMKLGEVEM